MGEEEELAAAYDDAQTRAQVSNDRDVDASEEDEEDVPRREIEDEGRIVGLTIHRTDKLKTDLFIAHPLVRVHVVDLDTGHHLRKTDRSVIWACKIINKINEYINA